MEFNGKTKDRVISKDVPRYTEVQLETKHHALSMPGNYRLSVPELLSDYGDLFSKSSKRGSTFFTPQLWNKECWKSISLLGYRCSNRWDQRQWRVSYYFVLTVATEEKESLEESSVS